MKQMLLSAFLFAPLVAVANPTSATIAVQTQTSGADDLGTILLEALEIELAGTPGIELVDRARLRDILAEQELGEAGITGEQAARFGKLVGASYYIFGQSSRTAGRNLVRCRVVQVDTGVYRPTMVMFTEDDDPIQAGTELAAKVIAEIAKLDERVSATKEAEDNTGLTFPADTKIPTIAFRIPETSVTPGAATADPAAEKTLETFLLANQFKLIQLSHPSQSYDVGQGAGFSVVPPMQAHATSKGKTTNSFSRKRSSTRWT